MCGFMYCEDKRIKMEDFEQAFDRIAYRGPDMRRIKKNEHGYFGFHRLSIIDTSELGMQPFIRGNSIAICNGELYGVHKLKQALPSTYQFSSHSDCELLLPLFETYGVAMFAMLDAEFACVLYDEKSNSLIAARDPFGIRGMFYGYHQNSQKIMFASEAKCLVALCDQVFPFPPGHYYQDGTFTCYYDVGDIKELVNDDLRMITKTIHERLWSAVEKRMEADVPIGYLLSGGLDSSIVCSIAAKLSDKPIRTFAIGMQRDAIDLKYAKMVADYIQSEHTEIILEESDVIQMLPELIKTLETWDITTIRASAGMYLLCKWIAEHTNIKVLFSGEISDELFGYKYTDFAPNPTEFQKEAQKRVRELYMYDVLRADRCISANGLEARVPFGDLAFSNYVMRIAPKLKMNTYAMGKYLLRKAFDDGSLPDDILFRDKAAFSDAVGHSLVDCIKAYTETLYSEQSFKQKLKTYSFCPPYTKESLYYREQFDQHYHGFAPLIQAYWMPNPAWKGCQVDDPSARVLANYGKSGI